MSELGSLLTHAREARGLTIEDAERDTRISRRYLQALEAEQFDVIPAPVYARGFLRSYSQYLGLDPNEVLAMFPRDDGAHANAQTPARASREQPVSAAGASRPSWRRPSQKEQRPAAPPKPMAPPPQQEQLPYEPTIGVDIGVPAPARRIKTDPAAQTRSMTVLIVAVGAIVGVLLVALLISSLGDDPDTVIPEGTATTSVSNPTETGASTGGIEVVPDVVPNVVGRPVENARAAITQAGFAVNEFHAKNAAPAGTVIDQAPAPGSSKADYDTVLISISEGP